jgi:hypothetical protein
MEITENRNVVPVSDRLPWLKTMAVLAPLWMIALATTAEGFPNPPISGNQGLVLFYAAIAVAILATFIFRTLIELPFITLIPLSYVFLFDEITTSYKTPFILFCTLILSLGIIAYHYLAETRSLKVALLVLLAVVVLTYIAAGYAMANFWAYTDSLGIEMCFLDYSGCPPLPADHPAWWRFFIGI